MSKTFKLLTIVAGLALISMPAAAYEKGDWIVRGGVGVVDPESTAYQDEDIIVKVDSGTSATFTATYMFTPNWAFDILVSWPFSHDINVSLPGIPGEAKLGETKHVPPTFSFQYHFNPTGKVMPYAGLGLNYTLFMDEKVTADPDLDLSIDASFGLAAQLGADVKINDQWVFNIDLRYINIEPDATLIDTLDPLDTAEVSIDINPLVYSLSFGYIFN